MSAARTAGRLTRAYPPAWRARYGEELAELILDMSEGGRIPWRLRADVVAAGGRERLRAAGLGDGERPADRVRSGTGLVLWAWALFVAAGAIVQKTSEHWEGALPTGSHPLAGGAFATLLYVAVATAILLAAAVAWAAPRLVELVRAGRAPGLRRRALIAAGATLVLAAATLALVLWARGLSGRQRDGHDTAYAVGFLAWAALGAACLIASTAAIARAARCLELRPVALRRQAGLTAAVAGAMAVMTAATATWWASVGAAAPAALTGGGASAHPTALVPRLVLALALMLLATALGGAGARRALRALPALAGR